jgi:hypothetical protein
MNLTALTKALKFACLPTLSLLLLLFFAFFSISETIAFISSNDGIAVTLRVLAFITEIIVVGVYYDKYSKEEIFEGRTKKTNKRSVSGRTDLYDLNSRWSSSDDYFVMDTEDSNIIYVERVEKSNNF